MEIGEVVVIFCAINDPPRLQGLIDLTVTLTFKEENKNLGSLLYTCLKNFMKSIHNFEMLC